MTDFNSHFNPKPIKHVTAVLISDIHYNLQTLPLADAATRQAIHKANEFSVPMIIAGDLHDSKANLRAECVNAMLETFKLVKTECFILVGNHDLTNEKANTNSIEFLDGLNDRVGLIRNQMISSHKGLEYIAYHSDTEKLKKKLTKLPKSITVIMHQGLSGSNSGEYIQDKTAITPADVAGLRVISGHYHTRQTIKLPNGGKWDYIGNPYTLNFGEANDPEKGYQILYDDGSLEFIPTNLRKHRIVVLSADKNGVHSAYTPETRKEDLVWVKVSGPKEFISKIDKEYIRKYWIKEANFKLDLIPTESTSTSIKKGLSEAELLDAVIDGLTDVSPERKLMLKELWKEL